MKKLMIALTIVVASLGISRPSQAIVGLATANPILAGVAGVMIISCGFNTDELRDGKKGFPIVTLPCKPIPSLLMWGNSKLGGDDRSSQELGLFISGLMVIWGVIFLDNETSTISFSKLSDEKGASLGMNDKEIASFNAEILSVNSVLDEASATGSIEESAEVWLKAEEELAPETMSAISKIGAAMRAQLQ